MKRAVSVTSNGREDWDVRAAYWSVEETLRCRFRVSGRALALQELQHLMSHDVRGVRCGSRRRGFVRVVSPYCSLGNPALLARQSGKLEKWGDGGGGRKPIHPTSSMTLEVVQRRPRDKSLAQLFIFYSPTISSFSSLLNRRETDDRRYSTARCTTLDAPRTAHHLRHVPNHARGPM